MNPYYIAGGLCQDPVLLLTLYQCLSVIFLPGYILYETFNTNISFFIYKHSLTFFPNPFFLFIFCNNSVFNLKNFPNFNIFLNMIPDIFLVVRMYDITIRNNIVINNFIFFITRQTFNSGA